MKTLPLSLLLAVLTGNVVAQVSFTYETDKILSAAGDFITNDGRKDLIVVDKETGNITLGIQNTGGSITWTAPDPGGITSVTSLAVDRLAGGTADRAAITAPAANRITLVDANATQLLFKHVYPTYPSPLTLAAFDADANGTAELFVAGDRVGPAPRFYYEFLGSINTTPVSLWQATYGTETTRVRPFVQKTGTAAVLAENYGSQFYLEAVLPTSLGIGRALTGVAVSATTLMTYGNFDGTAYSQVLLYNPGATTAAAAKVTEPTLGTFGWSAVSTITFPKAIKQLVTIPIAAGGARLGIVFSDLTAAVYSFNGTTLTLRNNLSGSAFDWLNPTGNDVLIAKNNSGWQRYDTTSTSLNLTPTHSGAFPDLAGKNRVSNVVFFSAEPFADPAAAPLAQGLVRDWSTAASGSATTWNVAAATASAAGIGTPTTTAYTSAVSSTHALPNQYRSNISIRNLEAAGGATVPDVIIQPASGFFRPGSEITLSLQPTLSGYQVKYRTNSASWLDYNANNPPVVRATAVVEAYAVSSSAKSPTRSASYTFSAAPALAPGASVDANNNGIPDAWEKAFNAPDASGDADGDGANNIAEYQAGTDPRNALDTSPTPPLILRSAQEKISNVVNLRLSWDVAISGAILETSPNLGSGSWQPVASGIVISGSEKIYRIPLAAGPPNAGFYRLRKP